MSHSDRGRDSPPMVESETSSATLLATSDNGSARSRAVAHPVAYVANVHPMERLRHLARSGGGDPRSLVRETAGALRNLGNDPAGLLVACRRLIERNPTSGPLWWLCAHVVTAAEPYAVARRLADELDADKTPETLARYLKPDARVCMIGWPDLAGEAILQRGDVSVLAVDTDEQTAAFVRRLSRSGVMAELIGPSALAAAVLVSDVVVVEALAAGGGDLLAANGSRAAASVAYCSGVPVIAVVGRGRCLPLPGFQSIVQRLTDVDAPWMVEVDVLPLELCTDVVGAKGVAAAAAAALAAECPMAPELLVTGPN